MTTPHPPDRPIDPEAAAALRDLVFGDDPGEELMSFSVRVVDRSEIPGGDDFAMVPEPGPGGCFAEDPADWEFLIARDVAAAIATEVHGDDVDPDDVERLARDQVLLMLLEGFDEYLAAAGSLPRRRRWWNRRGGRA